MILFGPVPTRASRGCGGYRCPRLLRAPADALPAARAGVVEPVKGVPRRATLSNRVEAQTRATPVVGIRHAARQASRLIAGAGRPRRTQAIRIAVFAPTEILAARGTPVGADSVRPTHRATQGNVVVHRGKSPRNPAQAPDVAGGIVRCFPEPACGSLWQFEPVRPADVTGASGQLLGIVTLSTVKAAAPVPDRVVGHRLAGAVEVRIRIRATVPLDVRRQSKWGTRIEISSRVVDRV